MIQYRQSLHPPHHSLTVPVMLELLNFIHASMCDDVVLTQTARTVERAIDELTALRQAAMDVMCEPDAAIPPPFAHAKPVNRRRLC